MDHSRDPIEAERVRASIKSNLFGAAEELRVGRYAVLRKLGQGAMGVVYAARDPELDRDVALKLLRAGARSSLADEAKAMARLRHANLVTVYDVGEHNGQVFIAMELVDGTNLREWLASPRSLTEILDVLEQAGRALAALHGEAMVHGDFKPDNVMVDAGGEARVGDFGLARPVGDASRDLPGSDLATTGSMAGTPAYMAPETFEGDITELSDQFSFCVSAYEALFGERPHDGDTVAELASNVRAGRVRDAPKSKTRPAWLRRLFLRGLAVEPTERFASMAELIDRLVHRRRQGRRRLVALAATALVGVSAAAVAFGVSGSDRDLCSGAERELGETWSAEQQARVREAFNATKLERASDSLEQVTASLRRHRQTWLATHTESCRATRSRGEVSEQVLDLRMACLARRKNELDALIDIFADADADVVRRSTAAVARVLDAADCYEIRSIDQGAPVPEDPGERIRVEKVRKAMATSTAQWAAGRYAESAASAEGLVAAAVELGYHPLLAEVHWRWARGLVDASKPATEVVAKAVFHAEAAGYDRMAANALTDAVRDETNSAGERKRVGPLLVRLDAATQRLGDPWVRATYLSLLGYASSGQEALDSHKQAVQVLERSGDHPGELSTLLRGVTITQRTLGNYKAAIAVGERGLALATGAFGANHPNVAHFNHELALSHWRLGDVATAYDHAIAGLRIRERSLGPDHQETGWSHTIVGNILHEQGKFAESVRHQKRIIDIISKRFGRGHPDVAEGLTNLGLVEASMGDYDAAQAHQNEALASYTTRFGPTHRAVGLVRTNLADLAAAQGQWSDAKKHAQIALSTFEETVGPKHLWTSYALVILGKAQLRLGRPARAVKKLERCLALRVEISAPPATIAMTRFWLGQALWDAGRQKRRALDLVKASVDGFSAANQKIRSDAIAWLTERGHPPAPSP